MEGYITPPTPCIAGPSQIGQIGAIAIGAYTEIVSIIAPSKAAAGDLVTVEVRVKNLYSDTLAALVGGYLDSTEIWFSPFVFRHDLNSLKLLSSYIEVVAPVIRYDGILVVRPIWAKR